MAVLLVQRYPDVTAEQEAERLSSRTVRLRGHWRLFLVNGKLGRRRCEGIRLFVGLVDPLSRYRVSDRSGDSSQQNRHTAVRFCDAVVDCTTSISTDIPPPAACVIFCPVVIFERTQLVGI